jgi:peptidoglycan/xylan/chitin deacetylase (PgdA/CDA1 family)
MCRRHASGGDCLVSAPAIRQAGGFALVARRLIPKAASTAAGLAKRMVAVLVSLFYLAGVRLYAIVAGGRERPPARSAIVLTYHNIQSSEAGRFDWQMELIKRRARAVFADEAPVITDERVVAVTFDDGFQGVVSRGLPVMAKHGVPATLFVPSGYLGREAEWIAPDIRAAGKVDPVVSADTLKSLDPCRVRIGSHTMTHPRLGEIGTELAHGELCGSRRQLEEILGMPVTMLSLPYGSFTPAVIEEAARCGYERVFANVPLAAPIPPLLARVNASPADWTLEFRLKVEGAYGWLAYAIPAKRSLVRGLQECSFRLPCGKERAASLCLRLSSAPGLRKSEPDAAHATAESANDHAD